MAEGTNIKLGADVVINARRGRPMPSEGRHSGKTLAGIDLDVTVSGAANLEAFEALLKTDSVRVEDPYVGRTYAAKLTQRSMHYVDGRPERTYSIEVREIDEVPSVHELEIEGVRFPVVRYSEDEA